MLDWCRDEMSKRLIRSREAEAQGIKEVNCDLAYHLMEDDRNRKATKAGADKEQDNWNMKWLTGDSLLAIVAGSDPTTVTLIGAFAEMAKHPEHQDLIYEEVKDVDMNDFKAIANLPHLNAIIKETLRLYPSLLSGGSRKTLDEPVEIGGRVIPPHTTIVAPRYTINRSKTLLHSPIAWL